MSEWQKVKIGDICNFFKGETRIAKANSGEYPLVVTGKERKNCDSFQFDAKAVCIPLVSSAGHGKASLNYVHYQEGKFALGSILVAVIPKDENVINAQFLHLYLSRLKDSLLVPLMKGTANVSLSVALIKNIEISLPKIKRQIEIVNLFNQIDLDYQELAKENANQQTYLTKLRQAILQEAIEGKLTVDWRKHNVETRLIASLQGDPNYNAQALLETIKTEKQKLIAEGKIKKSVETRLIASLPVDDVPFVLPDGWMWVRLGEVGLFDRGKSKHRPRNDLTLFKDGTIPFIQTGDVSQSKRNNGIIKESLKFYNDKGLAQSKLWDKNTLCITIAANIAETGFLGMNACFPDSVVGFTSLTNEGIKTSWFIKHYLFCIQDEIIKFAPATAQKNINLEIIGMLKFPLAPLAEQHAIVERVDRLLSNVNALEQQVKQRKTHAQQLMQAVLKEAFAE